MTLGISLWQEDRGNFEYRMPDASDCSFHDMREGTDSGCSIKMDVLGPDCDG